jgi:myo-inositol-1(or 4)-monophosphatase
MDLLLRFLAGCAIAREAGALAKRQFLARDMKSAITLKGPQDYLTESDAAVEALIKARLAEAFPEDGFLGEEGGGRTEGDIWVADPIDGTANFARGIPHFCVALAFLQGGQTEIGIIYNPMTDEMFAGARGRGASLNGEPMRVAVTPDLSRATVEIGWSSRVAVDPYVELVRKVKNAGANVRRAGSGALALAYVAAGRTDGYCELHMNAWDAVAGLLLIEEAGGYANDFLVGDGLGAGNVVLGCVAALRAPLAAAMGISTNA